MDTRQRSSMTRIPLKKRSVQELCGRWIGERETTKKTSQDVVTEKRNDEGLNKARAMADEQKCERDLVAKASEQKEESSRTARMAPPLV